MAASYPGTIKTFSTKAPGQAIASSHINDLQDEVVAVETTLGVNAGAWANWTPTFSGFDSMTVADVVIHFARYTTVGKICYFNLRATFTTGGIAAVYVTITVPKQTKQAYSTHIGFIEGDPVGRILCYGRPFTEGGNSIVVAKFDNANYGLGTNRTISINGFYEY